MPVSAAVVVVSAASVAAAAVAGNILVEDTARPAEHSSPQAVAVARSSSRPEEAADHRPSAGSAHSSLARRRHWGRRPDRCCREVAEVVVGRPVEEPLAESRRAVGLPCRTFWI